MLRSTVQSAIAALNSLQSNASTRQMLSKLMHVDPTYNVHQVESCLQRIGRRVDELDALRIVHVAGTKGKGSTAAMIESLLRHRGFKTGLYTWAF